MGHESNRYVLAVFTSLGLHVALASLLPQSQAKSPKPSPIPLKVVEKKSVPAFVPHQAQPVNTVATKEKSEPSPVARRPKKRKITISTKNKGRFVPSAEPGSPENLPASNHAQSGPDSIEEETAKLTDFGGPAPIGEGPENEPGNPGLLWQTENVEPTLGPQRKAFAMKVRQAIASSIVYPDVARRKAKEGNAVLRVLISSSGQIKAIMLETTSGHLELDRAALESARSAGPFPPPPGGPIWVRVQINFRLH